MRNIQRAISVGEQVMGQSQSDDADSREQKIIIEVGEGHLWERESASTAPTTISDPETLTRKYMTSPQKLQRTGQLLSQVSHRILSIMPLVFRSLLDPTFLILCYRPCPTVCPRMWDVFFISCFHSLRLQPSSLHCWVAAP